jgi:hypothetical protein
MWITACAADDTDGVAVELAAGEAGVAARELLVRDLCSGVGIAAALAAIDELFAEVLIVDVAPGHDDRVGPIVAT